MSLICNSRHGLIRRLNGHAGFSYVIELPCGELEHMNEEQFRGQVSVHHGRVCPLGCGYHETHDYGAAVAAAGGWRTV